MQPRPTTIIFFAQFDDVAERILQLGAKPIATVKGYLEAATLAEETGDQFDATTVIQSVLADFTDLLTSVKAANGLADADGDLGTQDLLAGLITWLEKEIWILKSTLG